MSKICYYKKPLRAKFWNYNQNAIYMITINVENRENLLGEFINNELKIFQNGMIVNEIWNSIPKFFPYIELGVSIVMPNHIHGIIYIKETSKILNSYNYKRKINFDSMKFDTSKVKETNKLSNAIRWFKGRSTFEIRKTGQKFSWQNNYYDSIIYNWERLENASNYILNNPQNWINKINETEKI